jgi:hypothetical protein
VTLTAADGERYNAEIRRTEYGIPHIPADGFGSLGYGSGVVRRHVPEAPAGAESPLRRS